MSAGQLYEMLFKKKKQRWNNLRQYKVEVLLDNSVDKDIQSILLPLNLMQNITLCPKYSIRDNFITPTSAAYNIVALCATIACMAVNVYRAYVFPSDTFNIIIRVNLVFSPYYDVCFYSIGFALNYFLSVYHTKRNILFVLTYQVVHKFLKDETEMQKNCSFFVIWNWSCFLVIVLFYSIMVGYINNEQNMPLYNFICNLLLIFFDFNTLSAIGLVKLLVEKAFLWNIKIQSLHSMQDSDEVKCKQMLKAYVNILQCYDNYKLSFQLPILYYTMDIISHGLMYIKVGIDVSKVFTYSLLNVSISAWLSKSLLLTIILSRSCEQFYAEINKIQDTCLVILNSNCTDAEKKLCKNIRRLHRSSFSRMSACGVFYVDAKLPLSLLGLITNYTVVFLQFAFL